MYEQVLSVLKEVKPTRNLENVSDIIEGGYLDSFELMLLISKLDEVFDIEITIDDIIPENFNSIDAIVKMVKSIKQ